MYIINRHDEFASFSQFAETALVPFYWFDLNHRMRGANNLAFLAIGDALERSYLGKKPSDVYSEHLAEKIIENQKELITTGNNFRGEEVVENLLTKETKIFDATLMPVRSQEGEIIGIKGVSIDITERKQKEELIKRQLQDFKAWVCERDRLKRTFIENCVHDINTPVDIMVDNSRIGKPLV